MVTPLQVFHRSARAISAREFEDALQAICLPRFPPAFSPVHRQVACAISGGVDSMALAFLFNRLKQDTHSLISSGPSMEAFRISDNILNKVRAVIIDHGLREGSDEEARKVANVIRTKFPDFLYPVIEPINWRSELGPGVDPKTQPNIETLGRKLRYVAFASACRSYNAVSLFTAHHEDDEYETILMRMISGRGYRGLQGIPPAADIPECYDIYNAYQSGYLDDQASSNPFWTRMPAGRRMKRILRSSLRNQLDPQMLQYEMAYGMRSDGSQYFNEYQRAHRKGGDVPPVPEVEAEDGGIMIYRPLLGFSKDRLTATCEENDIPWFEDYTNADPTFTPRNAIRYLVKHHNLPAALQKPAILQLGARCRARVAAEEAEAGRVLERLHVRDLATTAGTVEAEMPRYKLPGGPRLSRRSAVWRKKRLIHYRTIAAIIVRRLISLVTPHHSTLPTLAELEYSVSLLFPELRLPDDKENPTLQGRPKGYVIAGVHMDPLIQPNGSVRWRLSRAPYETKTRAPELRISAVPLRSRFLKEPSDWPTDGGKKWKLWDGRYWIRLRHRSPCNIRIAPFDAAYQKDFREGLLLGEKVKNKELLTNMLKVYAPGRIRYTLPAVYADADFLSYTNNNEAYWPQPPDHLRQAAAGIAEDDTETPTPETVTIQQLQKNLTKNQILDLLAFYDKWEESKYVPCNADTWYLPSQRKLRKLIALPTLGLSLPGAYDWVQCEVRYRKIDGDLLRRGTSWQRPKFWRTRDRTFKLRRRETLLERREWWGLRGGKGEDVPVTLADAFRDE
ncbi:hypothetical protein SMACR_02325 [Sordaria macrospora]|uniref:tRNA(Ile)-lysidine synthetase n=2 Tax=Sordaria macrospora TaxID=5147 RepID=F7VP88_SORMK|nr:uncharacterized protein SMAC_02325 [Sordaria macrospora k-hell]KAA8634117.1 hypothetical protein SMACR_02325 [Sordaria macrospora]WPJ64706.1 hypothetical protein SMAC4_02325 [Sordaria macrospora]CCC07316.1 unnamed protein product [Sordaria macrospora k-hell]